jgi:serine/threonine-protein kinase
MGQIRLRMSSGGSSRVEERLLRDRVHLYLKVLFFINLAFLAVSLSFQLLGIEGSGAKTSQLILGYSITALLGASWWYAARGHPSRSQLNALEALGTVAIALAYIAVIKMRPIPEGRFIGLALVSMVLVLRSALVPSAIGRTLGIGLLGIAAAVVGSLEIASDAPAHTHLWLAVFGLAFVAVTAVTSSVIYGLRREVRAARRLGQYELTRKIGEGGMGVVYEATHVMLRRPTALKLLPIEKAGEETVSRFEREVRQTSRLEHPNSVYIFDYGRTPEGQFYYAMEYLDGYNLKNLVKHEGPLGDARTRLILLQAAHALAEAHAMGLVHRDIKPSNIMVCIRGQVPDTVKVLDFGLVKAVDDSGADDLLTKAGTIVGTPHYMAPETLRNTVPVEPAADIYALGAVGYFLLTGRHVFEGDSIVEICAQHLTEQPRAPSEYREQPVDPELEALILRCLEKDPANRFSSGSELAMALESLELPGWSLDEARRWWSAHRPVTEQLEDLEVEKRPHLKVDIGARSD